MKFQGEFETGFERGGQTREHAMLVKTAGVKHLVILINFYTSIIKSNIYTI